VCSSNIIRVSVWMHACLFLSLNDTLLRALCVWHCIDDDQERCQEQGSARVFPWQATEEGGRREAPHIGQGSANLGRNGVRHTLATLTPFPPRPSRTHTHTHTHTHLYTYTGVLGSRGSQAWRTVSVSLTHALHVCVSVVRCGGDCRLGGSTSSCTWRVCAIFSKCSLTLTSAKTSTAAHPRLPAPSHPYRPFYLCCARRGAPCLCTRVWIARAGHLHPPFAMLD
jgi:hypothetical protein